MLPPSIQTGYLSVPQSIEFPTLDGTHTAHALFYPPTNALHVGPSDALPPYAPPRVLLRRVHIVCVVVNVRVRWFVTLQLASA